MENGYNVIFLHRRDSLKPYSRKLTLDSILCDESSSQMLINNQRDRFNRVKERLICIEFFSVVEYLNLLIRISSIFNEIESRVILYLAAAVSDFYIPPAEMPENKIESSENGLRLNLKPVPKMLGFLKRKVCPGAFVVSFKLETDDRLVQKKAKESQQKYGQDLVVSNCLQTRTSKVNIHRKGGIIDEIQSYDKDDDIETQIVKYVIESNTNKMS